MDFSEIIGQETVKSQLVQEIETGRLPHALMLYGPEGNGAYALALAIATRLLAVNESGEAMMKTLQHPDLHFSFPVFKKKEGAGTSDLFIEKWRTMVLNNPYISYSEWLDVIGADTGQLLIYVDESINLIKKLSLKSNQGGYKIVIMWLPEKMNLQCANKMLKLLEEPPQKTLFLLISEDPEQILPTIRSRTQMIHVPKIAHEDMVRTLTEQYHVRPADAQSITRISRGNMTEALRLISDASEWEEFFANYVELMRMAYQRNVKGLKRWSEDIATMGREKEKRFLDYCQRMTRENFINNFHNPEIVYMDEKEQQFSKNFSPYINESNVIDIMNELALCQRDVIRNVNGKILFFDFALKMIVLIKKGITK